ncbi:MAG: hypothetical protein HGA78_04615 [Nitrospirales bacterium]|nr:hypothetical protein [Nitrospirales bacterium]
MIIWIALTFLTFMIQTQLPLARSLNLSVVLIYFYGLRTITRQTAVRSEGNITAAVEIKGVLFGALIGLIEDSLSGQVIGPGVLSKGMVGLLISVLLSDVVFRWTPLFGCLSLLGLTLMDGLVAMGIRLLLGNVTIDVAGAVQAIVIQAVVNSPLGIIMKPREG